jgi:hypothetical protein
MTDHVTGPISVECHYGSGDRPLDAVVDSLIITEADAINRGYAELNRAWKIVDVYTVNMPYPNGGHVMEVGKYVKLTIPEMGLINRIMYIQGVSQRGTTNTMLTLKLETYEDYE